MRYGIIGTGMMGVEHIRDIAALNQTDQTGQTNQAQITALCDPDEGSLASASEAVAAAFDDAGAAPTHFADHRDLLAADICDAVIVATPNMSHAEVLLDVIKSTTPVLVEKPLCTTIEDCRRVVAATEAAQAAGGGFVWVGLEYRYIPAIAELIARCAEGLIGEVRMVAIREHRFPFLEKVGAWNRFNENTGGTLVEKCCHFFDLMSVITQANPTRVLASAAQDVNHLDERYGDQVPDILDNAYVIVEYDSGARAMLDLCMFADATRNQEELSVVGAEGKLEALVPESVVRTGIRGKHWIGEVDEELIRNPDITYEGHHHGSSYIEHIRFRQALQAGTAAECSPQDALTSVAVGLAAQLSVAQRRSVDLAEVL